MVSSLKSPSKERVLKAICHNEPDQIPFDYWGTPEYDEILIRHFALKNHHALRTKLQTDVRYIYCSGVIYENAGGLFKPTPRYTGNNIKIFKDGSFTDLWGVTRKFVTVNSGNTYRDVIKNPLYGMTTIQEIESYKNWPRAEDFDFSGIRDKCEYLKDYALILGGMPGVATIFIQSWYLRGLEQIMIDMALSPGVAHAIINKITEFQYNYLQNILEAIGDLVDILMLADDYGSQNGLLMSLQYFRNYFRKPTQQLIDLGKKYNLKIMFHADGNIYKLIPDFIEMGIDILNPIQEVAPEMRSIILKKEFGKEICFHGGIDTQSVLPHISADKVSKEVKNKMDILARGGGYIVSPTHMVQLDVPLQNILEMYKVNRNIL